MKPAPLLLTSGDLARPSAETDDLGSFDAAPGALLLNAGCGDGSLARALLLRWPQARVEGCDPSDLRLKEADRLGRAMPGLRFFKSPLDGIDATEGRYDGVVCRHALSELASPLAGARELRRVLKAGAPFCLIEWDGLWTNLFPCTPLLRG